MRKFLPALAALLLLLTLCACTKPSEEPAPSPAPPTEETKKLAVTVNPDGEEQRLILECPADWEAEYGCITCEGRLLVGFYAGEAEYVKSIWQPDKTKDHDIWGHQIGEREFLISGEEYAVSGESNANLSPYQSLSYYFAEDGIGLVRARYMNDESGQSTFFLKSNEFKPLFEKQTEYDYSTMKIVGSGKHGSVTVEMDIRLGR